MVFYSVCSIAHASDTNGNREDQLKAAYLFNFVKFVEWPSTAAENALTVCFFGANGVHDALATSIEGKHVGTRSLAVRQLGDAAGIAGCNVLYLEAHATPASWRISAVDAWPMLTVSDSNEFVHQGGMIELFTDGNRLRFSINLDNAEKVGLRISSDLLRLAVSVEKAGK